MMRAYRYRLHPTAAQATTLDVWLWRCRQLYNAALEQRRDAYRKTGCSLSRYAQCKDLTELRAADGEFSSVPAVVLRSALCRLQRAFDGFFRRMKRGEKPGYPRFKGRGHYDSFVFGNGIPFHTDGAGRSARVCIPKLGPVRFNRYRPIGGAIRTATIRFDGRKWWVSFACDVGEAPAKAPVASAVGIDLGLTSFATLSTGEAIPNPRFFRKGEALLARRQQALARKQRGSKSRHRAKVLVRAAHEHVHNQRLDHARKLACTLFARYDLVAHEALDIRGLIDLDDKGKGIRKSIHDAAWGLFVRCLASKAESAGKHAVGVDPRGTTKKCSGCGEMVPKTLWERIHRCPRCGLVMGRDHNAAVNIEGLGLSLVGAFHERPKDPFWIRAVALAVRPPAGARG
jgi:putative transposase